MSKVRSQSALRNGLTLRNINRGIKLKTLDGYQLNPIYKMDPHLFKIIKKHFDENEVISGSLVLNMFFNLQRNIQDIDVISARPHRFGDLYKTNYPEWEFPAEYIGSRDFSIRSFWGKTIRNQKVDFFRYEAKYFEWEGIKIQDPLEIIKKKSDIIMDADSDSVKEKHSIDLEIIGMKILHGIDIVRRSSGGEPSFCLPY
jgi:hypothetical protein